MRNQMETYRCRVLVLLQRVYFQTQMTQIFKAVLLYQHG